MYGVCRICETINEGQDFHAWVKDSFTNFDNLYPGDIICDDCLFWFDTRSTILMERTRKDKPQKMMNYSHFVKGGDWTPIGKGNKQGMIDMLLTAPFPELACIAVSGQKHIAFRARRNAPGQTCGWVQMEEQQLFVTPKFLSDLLAIIQDLYIVFSKTEIETGRYYPNRILKFGFERWDKLEKQLYHHRSTPIFELAIFLAQRSDDGTTDTGSTDDDSDAAVADLAGSPIRLQEQVPHDDLEPVRSRDQVGGLHQQPGQVHQLPLWSSGSNPGHN